MFVFINMNRFNNKIGFLYCILEDSDNYQKVYIKDILCEMFILLNNSFQNRGEKLYRVILIN